MKEDPNSARGVTKELPPQCARGKNENPAKERPMRYEPNDPVRLEAEARALQIYHEIILTRLPPGHRVDTLEHTKRHREEIVAELSAELLIFHSKGCDCRPDDTPAPIMRRVEAKRI
jgi:hypothetical protein